MRAPTWRGANGLYIARKIGLASGLQFCLDAGDAVSLPAASDKWVDLSGNGQDFFRGSGTGADAADPSINGTAGQLAAGNYLGFDGADYLTYDTTNETWMENVHKNNAAFTLACWFHAAADNFAWMGTATNLSSSTGFRWFMGANGENVVAIHNASSTQQIVSTALFGLNAWEFAAVSLNEAAGTCDFVLNNTVESVSGTYTAPSAGAATSTLLLGARGGPGAFIPANGRLGMMMAWSTAVPAGSLLKLRDATRGRYGV